MDCLLQIAHPDNISKLGTCQYVVGPDFLQKPCQPNIRQPAPVKQPCNLHAGQTLFVQNARSRPAGLACFCHQKLTAMPDFLFLRGSPAFPKARHITCNRKFSFAAAQRGLQHNAFNPANMSTLSAKGNRPKAKGKLRHKFVQPTVLRLNISNWAVKANPDLLLQSPLTKFQPTSLPRE